VHVRSAERTEPEQANHVDTVIDRSGICDQLATTNSIHAARRIPAAPDRFH